METRDRVRYEVDDEIDFVGLGRVALNYKLLIIGMITMCGLVAAIYAYTTAPIYRAEAVVVQMRDHNLTGAESVADQLGGIASLAGVNLPVGNDTDLESQAILQSRNLSQLFIKRYKLLSDLSPERNPASDSIWAGVERFKRDVLNIRSDARKGTTTISVDWTNPVVAAQWANAYVALANDVIRIRAIDDSTRNVAYLNQQIEKTTDLDLRRVMYGLVESETKTLMLANARMEYAFTVVDPAVPPQRRIRPKRTIIVLLGLAIGLTIGMMIALTHDKFRRGRVQARQ
ncbi:MAG: GNVR domain-containing protein [Ktedonobacteraceae bacterium]